MKKIISKSIEFSEAETGLKEKQVQENVLALQRQHVIREITTGGIVLIMQQAGNKKEKKETVVAKRLTIKEKAAIVANTKREVKALMGLPPAPYEIIIPAPAMSNLSAAALCQLTAPLFITIGSISEFAGANPSVGLCQAFYDELFPLSNIGRKISSSDKTKRDTLVKQLRDNFLACLRSCALLANGNLALYQLIGSPVKRKSTPSGGILKAVEFKLNLMKGRGSVGISTKKMKGTKGFIVRWGVGTYNPTTWNSQSGGATQVVSSGFLPGDYVYFVMIAFRSDGTEGKIANVQGCNIPFA